MTTPLLALLSLTGLALVANASEVASVAASTKGTLFDQAGTAVAKVATNNGDLRSTVRNYTSANVFMPAIARGQVDFGVANQRDSGHQNKWFSQERRRLLMICIRTRNNRPVLLRILRNNPVTPDCS
jgi:hypothetical protein